MAARRAEPAYWAVGALAWVLGMAAARPLIGSDPLVVVAQRVIDGAPGSLATWAIETFGKDAQTVLVVGVGAAIVGLGGVLGALIWYVSPGRTGRTRIRYAVALAVLALTALGFYEASGGLSLRWLLGTLVSVVPPAALWRLRSDPRRSVGRRGTLRGIGSAAGALAIGGVAARTIGSGGRGGDPQPGEPLDPVAEKRDTGTTTPAEPASGSPDSASTPAADRGEIETRQERNGVVLSVADTDADFGFDFEGMPARVGSADDHYVVDKTIPTPQLNADEWSLSVTGAVDSPRAFSIDELIDHPEARELTVTTVCISNPVGGRLVSTVDWRVVPVGALLEAVGVGDDAVDVVTRAADGYSEALPWSVVAERDDVAIAVGMDGRTLPGEHGFPARLLVPGRYGMKSTKWVTGIEVAPSDHEAYWEARGWDEEAVVETLSYVRAVQRRGDRVAVGGVAYAGLRGIDRVEVSVDGGTTWTDATLESPPSELAWRRFRATFDRPSSGPLDVVVRATDGEGTRQTAEETGPHPGGSTGWHDVTVSL